MTVEEIFSKISTHMVKGMMFHDQMSRYYNFLGLCGFAKCHEHHYMNESKAYCKLNRFFIERYNLLVPESEIDNPQAIPESWFSVTRSQIDQQKRTDAVKNGVASWVAWESMTKSMYQSMETELVNMSETNASRYIAKLVEDVSDELRHAEKKQILLDSVNYDAVFIADMQDELYEKYRRA